MELSTEREGQLQVETALARERSGLAREMHDVVSHQVSLIAVQAGALQIALNDPEHKEAIRTIHKLCRQTLDELRHMVDLLRTPGGVETEIVTQPGLADIPSMVRSSEIPVHLTIAISKLPPQVEMAIYRTVQEGLTNARKHAPGASVSVDIFKISESVEVKISNDAPKYPPRRYPSTHYGLKGLKDRADILGGSLSTESTIEGGFTLRFSVPISPA